MPRESKPVMSDTDVRDELLGRIASRRARVGVAGMGSVGLPVAAAMERAGFPVLGFDVDVGRVERLQAGISDLRHLGPELVAGMRARGRFEATADLGRLGEADAVLVCVPTPLGPGRRPDLSAVEDTAAALAACLRPAQLVVLESTTWPGTTREIVLPALEASGLRCGRDFFLAFSPEREDPGRRDWTTATTPRLVGAVDASSRDVAVALYSAAVETVIPVSSPEVAEAAKLLENIYRAVNIAMVNEMKTLLTAMGIDVWEVIEAASSKPFGFQAFRPGPGLGGHCIPIDPFYLAWKAEQVGQPARFIALAGEVNHAMPGWIVERTRVALADRGTDIAGAHVLVLGLAYKADIDDVRESPSFALIEGLEALGARVDYHDPHVPATRPGWMAGPVRRSSDAVAHDDAVLAGYDVVIVATDHAAYDWPRIARVARLVIDSRGALRGLGGDNVVSA